MSATLLIQQLRTLEDNIREQQASLDALRNDPRLRDELEFERELRALLDKHGRSLADCLAILDPSPTPQRRTYNKRPEGSAPRAQPHTPMTIYTNPHTGEKVEARNLLAKKVRAWCIEHGNDEVKTWGVPA